MTRSEIERSLAQAGIEDAAVEARILFSRFSGMSPAALLADPAFSFDSEELSDALSRRLSHEPLGYILGETEFCRETYKVTPDVLIPRPDTEVLVETAVKILPRGIRVADLCTGSGCVLVSLLAARKDLSGVGADVSAKALRVAKENAARNSVADRAEFCEIDLLQDKLPGAFGAILSNPPYIRSDVLPTLSPEVQNEPALALDGGDDGLSFYRRILGGYAAPVFLFEIGYDQGDDLRALASSHGRTAEIIKDYGGRDRVAVIR